MPGWLQLILEENFRLKECRTRVFIPIVKIYRSYRGKRIQYFKDYEEMNRFFIDSMG